MDDKCEHPRCKNESVLTWLNVPLCEKHWQWVCKVPKEVALKKLKRRLK